MKGITIVTSTGVAMLACRGSSGFNVIKYDFVKFGTAAVRDGLVRRWTREVEPMPK